MTNLNKDRDQVILEHILEKDNINHANSHLGNFETKNTKFDIFDKPWDETDKFRVAMIMAPAWGILFPPYNLAKLVGLIRHYNYSTKVYDLNIESYHVIKQEVGEDYWRGEKYFLWTNRQNFFEKVLPHLKPLFDRVIDQTVEDCPRVIGFSVYNTNLFAVEYLFNELKEKLPETCFIAGGPEILTGSTIFDLPFNYFFVGETEGTLIDLLDNLPETFPLRQRIGTTDSRLKLEELPFPDYSDYNLSNYQHPDGVSIETSRGCIAECSFCAETYFWKFRSNTPERVIEEIEHQIEKFGVKRFWFVDSLANGNLKNFRRLIDLVLEKEIDIRWNSYVRCDGRMDKAFIEKIKDSGCTCLSYGVESGSQKVLLDMRKKIEIREIENNLRDGAEVGLFNHVNWMIGFPTEEPIDFLHSLQLISNARTHIGAISPGFGAGPATASHMYTDWKVYGMVGEDRLSDKTFLSTWWTDGFKNTILHRFIRIKLLHVWLDILETHAGSTIVNSQKYSNINSFYSVSNLGQSKEYCTYDNFVNLKQFTNNLGLANEYLSLAYAIYLYFGSGDIFVRFDPSSDVATFGSWLTNDYTADFSISIKSDGSYDLKLIHKFDHHRALDETKSSVYAWETSQYDKSFSETINMTGNISDWISPDNQTGETVHNRRRKNIIPIVAEKQQDPNDPKVLLEAMLKKDAEKAKYLKGIQNLTE
jgi:anaerobic magnesium-protoporphyrin IX monomethyl ester cyclase